MTAVPPEDWPRPGRVVLAEARRRLDEVLDDSAATVADLTRFYDPGGDFAGPVFDDRTGTDPNEITAGDLLAITAMQVYAGPRAIGRFLRPGQPRQDVLAALRGTADVPLWEASPKQLAAAAELYRVTKVQFSAGNMWVSTGKLCARKRPRLIPVRDRVIVGGSGCRARTSARTGSSSPACWRQTTSGPSCGPAPSRRPRPETCCLTCPCFGCSMLRCG